jgi:hypothetical protein
MALDISRRGLITGLVALVAAPAIVRVSSIMPVKAMIEPAFDASDITWTACGGDQNSISYMMWYDEKGNGGAVVFERDIDLARAVDRGLSFTPGAGKGTMIQLV